MEDVKQLCEKPLKDDAETAYLLRLQNSAHNSDALLYEKRAAEKGCDDALWTLALRYAHGIGVEKDAKKALEYLNLMSQEDACGELLRAELHEQAGKLEIARDIYYTRWHLYGDCCALTQFLQTFVNRGEKIPPEYLEETITFCTAHDDCRLLHTAQYLIDNDYAEGYYIKADVLYKNDFAEQNDAFDYIFQLLETAGEKGCRLAWRRSCIIAYKNALCAEKKLEIYRRAAQAGEYDGAFYYADLLQKQGERAESAPNCSASENDKSCLPLNENNTPPHALDFDEAVRGGSVPALYRWALDLRKEGVKGKSQKYFLALKTVAQSEKQDCAFPTVAARYLLAEAYQYGIGVEKDLDEADVWYETVYQEDYHFLSWLKNQNDESARKKILRNLLAHDKRYRLCSRPRCPALPQWLKRFDKKLWHDYIAFETRFQCAQAYIDEASKYSNSEMPRAKAKALKQAIRLGNGAACDIFDDYYTANNMTQDQRRIKNLKKGVKLHNPCSMFQLGYLLSKSSDKKLQSEAFRLTQLTVNRGIDLAAIKNLSLFYKNGSGVEKNAVMHFTLMKQCFDEDKIQHFVNPNNLLKEFCSTIAYGYFVGNGIKQDVRKALLWFRAGADRGHAHCMKNLGWLYFDDEYDRESDALCRRWLEQAITIDSEVDDNIYHTLGYFYQFGAEGKQDYFQAVKHYRTAYSLHCRKDDERSVKRAAAAAYNLGVIYSQQLCDFENAAYWYKKALELKEGCSTLNNLANCYTSADKPDFDAAENLYRRIIKIAPAHSYLIGYAYSNLANDAVDENRAVPNREKAVELKKQAIEELETCIKLHESNAVVEWNNGVYATLAKIYLNGILTEKNTDKGRRYAIKGARAGNLEAVTICKKNGFNY